MSHPLSFSCVGTEAFNIKVTSTCRVLVNRGGEVLDLRKLNFKRAVGLMKGCGQDTSVVLSKI